MRALVHTASKCVHGTFLMEGKRVGSSASLPAVENNKRRTEVSPAVTVFDTSFSIFLLGDGNHIEHRVEIGKRAFVLLQTPRSTTMPRRPCAAAAVLRPRVQVLVGPRGLPGARGASGLGAGLKSGSLLNTTRSL